MATCQQRHGLPVPLFPLFPARHLPSSFKDPRQLAPRLPKHPERDKDPQDVEEDQVQPQVDRVVALQVGVAAQPLGRKRHEAAVQLARREHRGQEPHARLQVRLALGPRRRPRRRRRCRDLGDQVADVERRGPGQADGQDLERDDGQVGAAPAAVGLCVFLPQARHGRGRVERPVAAVAVVEEEGDGAGAAVARDGRVREVGRRGRELGVGEEAVEEVGALDEEVGEEVVGVPEEEEAEFGGRGFRGEDGGGEELRGGHEREGDGEGQEGARVEGEGFRGVDVVGHCFGGGWVGYAVGDDRAERRMSWALRFGGPGVREV